VHNESIWRHDLLRAAAESPAYAELSASNVRILMRRPACLTVAQLVWLPIGLAVQGLASPGMLATEVMSARHALALAGVPDARQGRVL
jgi:hypothetical protein